MAHTNITDMAMQLRKKHQDKHILCDRLEAIADALPNNIDVQICTTTAHLIDPVLKKAHTFEEQQLYPALTHFYGDNLDQIQVFERLRTEHYEDRCFGEEVRDILLAYGVGTATQSPNATGYMLRGFFEGLRRHMAFEAELARPLLQNKNGARHKA